MKYKLLFSFFYVNCFLYAGDKLSLFLSSAGERVVDIVSSRAFLLCCCAGIIANTVRNPLTAPFFRVPFCIKNDYRDAKATLLWKKIQSMNTCQKTSIDQFVRNNKSLFPYFGGEDAINDFIAGLKLRVSNITTLIELKGLIFDEEVLRDNDSYLIRSNLGNIVWRELSPEEKVNCNLKAFLNYFDSMTKMKWSHLSNISIMIESSFKIMVSFLELLFIPSIILFFKK